MKWSDLTTEERDALIAEKIFNRNICRGPLGGPTMYREDAPLVEGKQWYTEDIPGYSTDMNTAWEVMKAMTAIEMEDLGNKEKRKKRERFDDALTNAIGPFVRGMYTHALVAYHVAKLTPRIICLAALEACGVDIEP